MTNTQIAEICHESNRAYCRSIGDNSQPSWEEAPQWQKDSALVGVEFCKSNPDAPASANHDSWWDQKKREGWVVGPVKDPAKKKHPCCVPYDQLPIEQRRKDALFKAIVAALTNE